MRYTITKGNLTLNGLYACSNYLFHELAKDPDWHEGRPEALYEGSDDKTAYAFFGSGNWYMLDFQHVTAIKIPKKVIEVLIDENETQRKAGILLKNLQLIDLMIQHMHSGTWSDGLPVRPFYKDDYCCIEYESGRWWHYDIDNGTWF